MWNIFDAAPKRNMASMEHPLALDHRLALQARLLWL